MPKKGICHFAWLRCHVPNVFSHPITIFPWLTCQGLRAKRIGLHGSTVAATPSCKLSMFATGNRLKTKHLYIYKTPLQGLEITYMHHEPPSHMAQESCTEIINSAIADVRDAVDSFRTHSSRLCPAMSELARIRHDDSEPCPSIYIKNKCYIISIPDL